MSVTLLSTLGAAEESPGGLSCLMHRVGGTEGGRGGRECDVYFSLTGESLVSIFQTML